MRNNDRRLRSRHTTASQENRAAWLFLLPSLIGVLLFVLLPFVETIRRSMFDTMGSTWVGFSNYDSVLQNDAFQLAVANTARFLGICLPLLLSGSLILALVLHSRPLRETKAARVFKTTFLLPIAIPVASIVLLWQTLFSRQGLCNGWLTWLGAQPVDFMGTGAAFWVLTATYLWKNCGYTQVLWATGLEAIPADQYEAARVDGAGPWQQFCHITWPALQPTLVLTLILSLLNAFKVFREAYLVAGRYPQQSIYLLQHLFNNWFLSLDLPRLAAAAILVALVLLAGILALLKWWDHCAKEESAAMPGRRGDRIVRHRPGLPDPGRAAGMVAALVSLHRCSDAGRGVGADGRPCAGAAQWLRCLAYSADLAHFGTFADALVGYTAVFCDVLEQYGAIRHSSGRPVIGRRTGCVGHQQTAFPRPRGGSRFVYRFNAIAFPGHNGSQLSGSTSIRSIGYPLGCHFARYLLNFSGFHYGARL